MNKYHIFKIKKKKDLGIQNKGETQIMHCTHRNVGTVEKMLVLAYHILLYAMWKITKSWWNLTVNICCCSVCMHACFRLSHFSPVRLFATLWTVGCQLLCPWDSPGKSTGVGCHALLQEIFPTQGLILCLLRLLHGRQILYRYGWTCCSLSVAWSRLAMAN